MPASGHPRVLIVRTSAVGDVIHALPVLWALRDALPGAMLAWVVEGRTAELLAGHPALDELITTPRGWLKSPSAVWRLRCELRKLDLDVAIDVQGLTKSAAAAWLSGARRRIGFAGAAGRELSRWLNNVLVLPRATHVVDRNLALLRPLGIKEPHVRFALPERPAERLAAEQIFASLGLADGFAVINPGAGWPSKLWPTARFAAVARHLAAAWTLPSLVVWAGDEERRMAESIAHGSGGAGVMAPPTSLLELAAVARRAALFVSSDTGPLHLAAAVGTPCVGLFGPMPAERNGPYGPQHVAVQRMRLAGSSRQRRTAGGESMEAIAVEHVTAACDAILARGRQARQCA